MNRKDKNIMVEGEEAKDVNAKNKRTAIYLVVLTAFALVVLVGATYAYYVNDITFGDEAPVNTNTGSKTAVFLSNTTGSLELTASQKDIGQYEINTTPISTANATVEINLTGTTEYETTYCYYDIIWQYTSDDKYTSSDPESLPYTKDGVTYPFELSMTINGVNEKDLSHYNWDETGKTFLVANYVIGTAQSADVTVTKKWNLVAKMYNIDHDQSKIFDRVFSAYVKAESPSCYTKKFEAGKLHVIGVNNLTHETPVELSAIPKYGEGYTFDNGRTFCAKGGKLGGYNSTTGQFTSVPTDDECFAYFIKNA